MAQNIKTEDFWKPFTGAVSLTFDDGTENQLQKAVPLMDKYVLKGTFYVHPHGTNWREKYTPWQQVAENGHEVGNHTMRHLCPENLSIVPGKLEECTLQDIKNDIMGAQERLNLIAPKQKDWTFAYPCYATFVGKGEERKSYVPVVAKHFIAGRSGGEYGFGNNPDVIDLACVSGIATDRMSGFEMIGLVEELTHLHQWVILIFHEIDGQRLTVGSYDFEMLLKYLHRKSAAIWTAPVVQIAQKIIRHRNTT
jgi:peptidoglycan-N-acetylglucosamine deacetylase